MIGINQSCNRQCKDCNVYSTCSLRHIIPLEQESISNNLNYENNRRKNKGEGITCQSLFRRGLSGVLYKNQYNMCDCRHVHKLKHTLHLCELDEIADNFKI